MNGRVAVPVHIDPVAPASLDCWQDGPAWAIMLPEVPDGGMDTMSTDTSASVDVSFWEKLGDGLSAFSEATGQFLTRLFGSSNQRYVRSLGYIRAPKGEDTHTVISDSLLAQVNDLEERMRGLSDE